MAVNEVGEIYRCNICGNEVRVIKVGGGTLVCCGQEMQIVKEQEQPPINIPDAGG
jgi:desulfoferrodoxin-like iron-binding protein